MMSREKRTVGAAVAVAWLPSQKPLGLLVLPHPHIFLAGRAQEQVRARGRRERGRLEGCFVKRTVAAVAVASRVPGLAARALAGLGGHAQRAADWKATDSA